MSTIPLPALDIKPPQPNDALGSFEKLMALRSLSNQQTIQQQQIAAQQQEAQIRQQQLADTQATTSAMKEWDGQDYDVLAKKVLYKGGSANAVTAIQQHALTVKKTVSDIAKQDSESNSKNLETFIGKQKAIGDTLEGVENVPDDQLHDHAIGALNKLVKAGVMDSQTAQQLAQGIQNVADPKVLRQHIDVFAKSAMGAKAAAEQAHTEAQTSEQTATAEQKRQESQWYKDHPGVGAPGVPQEAVQQADWLAKNPGKTPSDFLSWKAKQAPLAQIQVAQSAGGGMDQAAVDQAAEYYHLTGKLPPGGRGVAGIAQNRQIMNRAAALYPGSMTTDSAEYAANKKSLDSLQKNFDQVTAFENTAGKNLDTFLGTAQKVLDAGSPLIDMPLRKAAALAGSADQAAFNAARTTALTEISKVLNSSNASGVLSDSARHEVEELIGPNASLKQIAAAAQILKQDMANRHQAYQDQIGDIQKRIGGKSTTTAAPIASDASSGFSWDSMPKHQ